MIRPGAHFAWRWRKLSAHSFRRIVGRTVTAGGRQRHAIHANSSGLQIKWALCALLVVGIPVMAHQSGSKPPGVERLRVQVVRSYPHDRAAFTQGLLLDEGRLFESTGLVGESSLREVELTTGRVIRKVDVPPPIFAEGLAVVGDNLIQLTWQNGRALIYNKRTFARAGDFTYKGEGWGLCPAGSELVMSDGSATLTFRRPGDFGVIRTINVTMDGQRLDALNELECVGGDVYANVWMRDLIVRIDAKTGRVTQRIDAPNLLSPLERSSSDMVLNGIAYDAQDQTFLITGKLWPKLFRVKFVK
jgi:glutaminyl-peptide cyclotransferase